MRHRPLFFVFFLLWSLVTRAQEHLDAAVETDDNWQTTEEIDLEHTPGSVSDAGVAFLAVGGTILVILFFGIMIWGLSYDGWWYPYYDYQRHGGHYHYGPYGQRYYEYYNDWEMGGHGYQPYGPWFVEESGGAAW